MLWLGPLAVCSGPSRKKNASGTMMSATIASTCSALCQPKALIKPFSTGTMRNWPNEPAAAVTPMAHERLSGVTLRPITP